MLCKCSGKYIDIYFNLKITYIYLYVTIYYRVKGENLRLVFVVEIHGSPFTREILLDS